MNQQLQEICELFIANKETLEKKFKLVMSRYSSGKDCAQTTILTSSVSVMIAEQMAMLAAVTASVAVSTASN